MSIVAGKPAHSSAFVLSAVFVLLSPALQLFAQTTVSTGSIVGTVSDPSGAILAGAQIRITNAATGHVISLMTNALGSFNSGALVPGDYKTEVAAKGFNSVEVPSTVFVGNTATVNVRLQIGQQDQVVEVRGSEVQVNTLRTSHASRNEKCDSPNIQVVAP